MKKKSSPSRNKEKKVKNEPKTKNIIYSKRFRVILICFFIVLCLLMIRIAWLQFIDGASLKEQAYKQQTTNQIISTKRGTIYDATGKKLAISSSVDTVTINPSKIVGKTEEETKAKKELVAKGLSEIFELDYNETLEKVNSTSSVETIIKKVENDKIEELEQWMKDNSITVGINIDEDTKRTYPYGSLASNVIGFCGDERGLQGIESKWNDVLTGTPGKIVTAKDAVQEEIPDQTQTYIPAENGSDLVLSIDVNIQTILEKYLKQAVEENEATRGGTVIAMKPSTGDVLGMAQYPNYDLNDPFTPNTEDLQAIWDTLDSETKTNELNAMWRNRNTSDTYEPGSPFKLITAATALEENITSEDVSNDFYCDGHQVVADYSISCWTQGHKGPKTLRQALQVSCNPSFIQLGQRIGAETLYKYYDAFGFFDKTGIALPGESNSIFHDFEDVGDVELATMSFGQRIKITPLQMISAVCAIANDGVLMQPRIVKQVINTDTQAVTDIEPVEVRQVISKTTSERMRDLMKSVVTDGSGRHAQVAGYSIGGKTGTSEPDPNHPEDGYVASYVAIAPAETPEICLLLALYNPTSDAGHQGGQVCGPVIAQMLSEILPYLGLTSSEAQTAETTTSTTSSSSTNSSITVPDVRNKTVTEAEKILQQAGFKTVASTNGNKNELLVTDQVPTPGTTLAKDSIIVLYTEDNEVRVSVKVPDLNGMTLDQAKSALTQKNLNIQSEGTGIVVSQDIAADSSVNEGTVIKVTLQPKSSEE